MPTEYSWHGMGPWYHNTFDLMRKIPFNDTAYRTWRSCFGPWVGSDWKKASLHTTGEFFKKQLTTKPEHPHKADHTGPAWTHSAGNGWLLLKGPSSEYWFNPWVNCLSQKGVRFFWEKPLTRLNFDGTQIVSAFAGDEKVVGDAYIIAINPFIMAEVLSSTPELEKLEVLNLFKPLTMDGPHTQVSFRLAFPEKINFPRQRVGVVVCDSEFNLTLFAQEQVWHEWEIFANGIKHLQPKWVTTQNTQAYMPPQKTPVANLFLAGSHTAIKANVWSIEGAVESGRRAANAIDQRVEVIDQHRPGWLHLFARIDDILYKYKGPQIVDFAIMLSALLILAILFAKLV